MDDEAQRAIDRLSSSVRNLEVELQRTKDDVYSLERRVGGLEQDVERLERGY